MAAGIAKAGQRVAQGAAPIFRMAAGDKAAIAGEPRDTVAMQIGIGQNIDAYALGVQEAQQVKIDREKMRCTAERIAIIVAQSRQRPAEARERNPAAVVMGVIERGEIVRLAKRWPASSQSQGKRSGGRRSSA